MNRILLLLSVLAATLYSCTSDELEDMEKEEERVLSSYSGDVYDSEYKTGHFMYAGRRKLLAVEWHSYSERFSYANQNEVRIKRITTDGAEVSVYEYNYEGQDLKALKVYPADGNEGVGTTYEVLKSEDGSIRSYSKTIKQVGGQSIQERIDIHFGGKDLPVQRDVYTIAGGVETLKSTTTYVFDDKINPFYKLRAFEPFDERDMYANNLVSTLTKYSDQSEAYKRVDYKYEGRYPVSAKVEHKERVASEPESYTRRYFYE